MAKTGNPVGRPPAEQPIGKILEDNLGRPPTSQEVIRDVKERMQDAVDNMKDPKAGIDAVLQRPLRQK